MSPATFSHAPSPVRTQIVMRGQIGMDHSIKCREFMFNPYTADGLFGQCKMMQKSCRKTETVARVQSSESTLRELCRVSNEYQHDRIKRIFNNLCVLVLWTKVASVLKELKGVYVGFGIDTVKRDDKSRHEFVLEV